MNDTKIKARELVEQVKQLKPEVEEMKTNAELKSRIAEAEERKAALVLETQEKVKEEVEQKKNAAFRFFQNCEKELKEAEKFKLSASLSVEKLREDAIRSRGLQTGKHPAHARCRQGAAGGAADREREGEPGRPKEHTLAAQEPQAVRPELDRRRVR